MRKLLKAIPGVRELAYRLKYHGLPEPFRTVRPHSMLSYINLFCLQELARRLERAGIAGDFVECGVYRGGSAGVLGFEALRSRFPRHLWLYDSFAGMPPATAEDDAYSHEIAGQFVGSEEQTRTILKRLRVGPDRFTIGVGLFEQTLPSAPKSPVALLHVDCDFHDPVRLVLETFYPSVVAGGYVVLNDYGAFQGCRTATDAFLAGRNDAGPLIQIDQDAYYFQKLGDQPSTVGNT